MYYYHYTFVTFEYSINFIKLNHINLKELKLIDFFKFIQAAKARVSIHNIHRNYIIIVL